ncbi:MAG: tRNA uridine-5-carboxymethylaminomethyl(34) synthesis enzyme MnmG [Alphaproteobacteria bacterium]|nr:tRNA uridine-5-carboxymethylaminomethyl(34) synthesis enzyme MnmG [Alphaproteobacteria bacterium]
MSTKYDVIVIGGGHAGCEAACAAARVGAKTLLVTFKKDNLGEMSCNPAIGGVAKGTIVKEIDALGGIMGIAIDQAGIHYKMLNASKGPAVWGPRAQADRKLYKKAIQKIISEQNNLTVLEDAVEEIIIEHKKVLGVVAEKQGKIFASKVVLTTGTFLNGVIHVGEKKISAGRVDEAPSVKLAECLKSLNFDIKRLRTGTPARIHKDSLNYDLIENQSGDEVPRPFSHIINKIKTPQIDCYITRTNKNTHDIIKENIEKSGTCSGEITSSGPRYCPSIELKILRFPNKDSHQIFLEPEGLDSDLIYPNGLSTALPEQVQEKFIKSIRGLENANIIRYGYTIEYDFIDPRELNRSLETKKVKNLYFAGQINGTTGYEEAAGQGMVAGLNAAVSLKNKEFLLTRADSYIGVMIDDLITSGAQEPYRMFTSRSEYRLTLRADNADIRLTRNGYEAGSVSKERLDVLDRKEKEISRIRNLLKERKFTPYFCKQHNINMAQDGVKRSAFSLLSYPHISLEQVVTFIPELGKESRDILDQISIEAKYHKYLSRQEDDIKLFQKNAKLTIPEDFDFAEVPSLSIEVREKIAKFQPKNVSEISSIEGVTPAAITSILVHLTRKTYA